MPAEGLARMDWRKDRVFDIFFPHLFIPLSLPENNTGGIR